MSKKLHLEIFPQEQADLFNTLCRLEWISDFYLVGGTALALQMGHRRSLDFDFFRSKNFNIDKLVVQAKEIGKFELYGHDKDTLNAAINGVRISFFISPYPLMRDTISYKNISIADKFDIALMKLNALSGRGNKKDFVDLYFLLKEYDLAQLIKNYQNKYGIELSNVYHLYKSLIYFEDAEQQPAPKMLQSVPWQEVKKRIIAEVKKLQI